MEWRFFHSNTTLVKVKLSIKNKLGRPLKNSNTTLVKVKSLRSRIQQKKKQYSNTTLVKVKFACGKSKGDK